MIRVTQCAMPIQACQDVAGDEENGSNAARVFARKVVVQRVSRAVKSVQNCLRWRLLVCARQVFASRGQEFETAFCESHLVVRRGS